MRVTDEMVGRMMVQYFSSNRDALFKIQNQVSSGLRVALPSDDPGAYSVAQALRTAEARASQYQVNSGRAESRLQVMDQKLRELSDTMSRVTELAMTASDGTKSAADRQSIAEEMNQLLESVLEIANSTDGGERLFGGLRSDTAPFVATRDAKGNITAVTYQGNRGTRFVEVADGVYIPVNLPGADSTTDDGIFQNSGMDMFNDIIRMRDRLYAGENPIAAEDCTADSTADTFAVNGVYSTGSMVTVETDGVLPAGLSSNINYYVISSGPGQIQLAASYADALAGTAIDFTDNGTGQLSVRQQAVGEISRDLDQVLTTLARLGGYQERNDLSQKIVAEDQLAFATGIEREIGVDTAKAAVELQNRQSAYQSAMLVASKILNTSLLNYM